MRRSRAWGPRGLLAVLTVLAAPFTPALAGTASAEDAFFRVVAVATWGPDTDGMQHWAVEAENVSAERALIDQVMVHFRDLAGNTFSSVGATPAVRDLQPGERSVTEVVVQPPAQAHTREVQVQGQSHASYGSRSPAVHDVAWTLGQPTVDATGRQVIPGTVTDRSGLRSVRMGVVVVFRDAAGALVDAATTVVNSGGHQASLHPGQTAAFEVRRMPGAPAYATASVLAEGYAEPPACVAASSYNLHNPNPVCVGDEPRTGAVSADAATVIAAPDVAQGHSAAVTHTTVAVLDEFGARVPYVPVTLSVTGNGVLRNRYAQTITDGRGYATVASAVANYVWERSTWIVTATIDPGTTRCGGYGGCTASTRVDWQPEAMVTTTPTPGPPPPTLSVDQPMIRAGEHATLSGTTGPGAEVSIYAYSRPSTTYRRVRVLTADVNGRFTTAVYPATNTRIYAFAEGKPSASLVVSVRSAISLTVQPLPGCALRAVGRVVPTRPGQRVNLYYSTFRQRVLAMSALVASDGTYAMQRRFSGCGETLAWETATGADMVNAAGRSPMRVAALRR